MIILAIACILLLTYYCPRYTMFLITIPIVGVAIGGLGWGIISMLNSSFVSWPIFGEFLLGGIIIAFTSGILLDH